ncbi:MAG: DUF4145 domain-containing protein [Bacteroidetes bacterium]|nr:DUF4145 domain-containing protein [Bacteroidota bacterium]
MGNIENIDEIVLRYFKANIGLNDLINELAKGDWSKIDLIYNNNEKFRELYKELLDSLKDFENATTAGKVYTCSDQLLSLIKSLEKRVPYSKEISKKCQISVLLEHTRWDWLGKIGDVEDAESYVERFDAFFKLPNYDPDNWLKRKFTLKGIFISTFILKNVPESVVQGYNESCACFIYGNYLATVAMARSVLELMLKDKFQEFANYNLSQILSRWDTIDKLKNKNNYKDKVKFIKNKGNAALHEGSDKLLQLFNEMTALKVINNLRELIEFICA